MRVLRRIIIKVIVLVLTVAIAASARMAIKFHDESTSVSALNRYLGALLEAQNEEAYALLDHPQQISLGYDAFVSVAQARKYMIFADYHCEAGDVYTGESGHEQIDYHVSFVNAEDELLREEVITTSRQEKEILGYFDSWTILPEHCMFQDFSIQAVKGSDVYVDGVLLSKDLCTQQNAMIDTYTIPAILPVETTVTAVHKALDKVEQVVVPSEIGADLTTGVVWKDSAANRCEELAIEALQFLYSTSAKNTTGKVAEVLAACEDSAKEFIRTQRPALKKGAKEFFKLTISDYQKDMTSSITEDSEELMGTMKLSYHYELAKVYDVETQDVDDYGDPIIDTDIESTSGELTATFTFVYEDGDWSISAMEVPVI